MKKHCIPLVYASGTTVYGFHDNTSEAALPEDATLHPPGPYIEEKVWAENEGIRIATKTGISFTALRICAPYGPGQASKTVLNIFMDRALRNEKLYYYGNGSREQDFTYADDIGRAFVLALQGDGGIFNIAGGHLTSMRELAELVAALTGLDSSQVQAAGKTDPQDGVLARFDISAARKRLSWQPEVTLKRGIQLCIESRRSGLLWKE